MNILPAIDIRNRKCVRLFKGDYKRETVYSLDPISMAQNWESQGAKKLHIVDLDGAKEGRLLNIDLIGAITSVISIPVQVGGGIRSINEINILLENGVSQIILGSLALEDSKLLDKAISLFGDKIIVSLDCEDDILMKNGWLQKSKKTLVPMIKDLEERGVKSIIYTDITKDGTLTEPNFGTIRTINDGTEMNLTIAGGISTKKQIEKLRNMKIDGVIIGTALYEGMVNLKEGRIYDN